MNEEEVKAVVSFLVQTDVRFFYCTLNINKKGTYVHNEKKCPKCVALKILGLSTDM